MSIKQSIMKTNFDNNHNAVFSSPLPLLLVLLVIFFAFSGKLNAGENSTDADNESVTELHASERGIEDFRQDTEKGHYDRYYRTLITDPVTGREKLVELRYTKDERLIEVLIDNETLTRAERRKNEKIIRKAMVEEKNVGKEIDELIDGIGYAMEEIMGVISDLFSSDVEGNFDPEISKADSSMVSTLAVARWKDREERIRTLEELESGQIK